MNTLKAVENAIKNLTVSCLCKEVKEETIETLEFIKRLIIKENEA